MKICIREIVFNHSIIVPRSWDENQTPEELNADKNVPPPPQNVSIAKQAGGLKRHSQVVGLDQQVGVVEQDDLGPLGQQEEGELDEEHQSQLADAADVQEDGAGQQGQQHAVAEVLRRHRRRGGDGRKGYAAAFSCAQQHARAYVRACADIAG